MKNDLVVIFDFDGTIADTMSFIKPIMDELSVYFDFKKTKISSWEDLKNKEIKDVFKGFGISLTKLPFILNRARKVFYKEIDKVKPIEGIEKALLEIKKESRQIGILTSSQTKTVEKFLKINNLDFFDFIYSEGNLFNKARKLNKLLKEKNFNVKNVFYVGDEVRDIEAARSVGVKAVAVSWGFNGEELLKKQKPDYLVKKPEELIALLANV